MYLTNHPKVPGNPFIARLPQKAGVVSLIPAHTHTTVLLNERLAPLGFDAREGPAGMPLPTTRLRCSGGSPPPSPVLPHHTPPVPSGPICG